jgi:hypothetical protein
MIIKNQEAKPLCERGFMQHETSAQPSCRQSSGVEVFEHIRKTNRFLKNNYKPNDTSASPNLNL